MPNKTPPLGRALREFMRVTRDTSNSSETFLEEEQIISDLIDALKKKFKPSNLGGLPVSTNETLHAPEGSGLPTWEEAMEATKGKGIGSYKRAFNHLRAHAERRIAALDKEARDLREVLDETRADRGRLQQELEKLKKANQSLRDETDGAVARANGASNSSKKAWQKYRETAEELAALRNRLHQTPQVIHHAEKVTHEYGHPLIPKIVKATLNYILKSEPLSKGE